MIIMGSDVTGNSQKGNAAYIAIVLGTEDAINQAYKKIGLKRVHMFNKLITQMRSVDV